MPKEKRKSTEKKLKYTGEFSLNYILDERHLASPDNEIQLRIQKKFFESLFNLSPEGIAILNTKFEIIHCNAEFLKMFEYDYDEVKSKLIYDVITPERLIDESKLFMKRLLNGELIKADTKRRTKTGKEIDVSLISKKIVLDESHSAVYIIYRDITEKKKFEEELIKEKQYLRALMDNIPDTIYFKDNKSRFTNINKAQVKLLGAKSVEDAIGKTDFDFFTPEHAKGAYEDEQKIIKTGTQLISKLEKIKMSDGNYRWFLATKVPIYDPEGENIIGIVGISRDIHELESAKEELRETAEKLKISNASKDKFFSIIAHDLKNPFNSLLGLSEILLEDFDEMSQDQILEMIEGISEAAKSSYHLLENLLQWSRTQTGRIHYHPAEQRVEKIFKEELNGVNNLAKAKNINLVIDACENITVWADENMFKTILRNLVTNSIKFTPENGTVKVSCRKMEDCVELIVEDTGIGMDDETIENLFKMDIFHTTTGTANETGSGIGLMICDEFVKKHGGRIKVESEIGKGSKFICVFPKP